MVYLIVLLALALVIGPVLWMRPSPAQSRQVKVRMAARAQGLEVRITELPQTRRARVRQEDVRQGAVYRLPVFDPRTLRALSYRSVREPGAAEWESEGDPLPPLLGDRLVEVMAQMPADVVALELSPQGPMAYWSERGGEEAVVQVAAQLRLLRDAMMV